jgi:hypothetical protein
MFRNASQKRLFISQLPSPSRSSEVISEEKLVSRRAVCSQVHVGAERVGESKVKLGHTYQSGICAQVSSLFLILVFTLFLSESQNISLSV